MLKQIEGDLLAIKEGVILHQTNCLGVTGGLAGALRRKHPGAFKSYLETCESVDDPLGTVVLGIAAWKEHGHELRWDLLIAHVFGQRNPGANTDLKAVDLALSKLARQLQREEFRGVPVHAPFLMGCGLGGGNWSDYSALLEKYLPEIVIVKLPLTH